MSAKKRIMDAIYETYGQGDSHRTERIAEAVLSALGERQEWVEYKVLVRFANPFYSLSQGPFDTEEEALAVVEADRKNRWFPATYEIVKNEYVRFRQYTKEIVP